MSEVRPFATPEILDVTEVEKARLHEAGETERFKLKQVAETKQKRFVLIDNITDKNNGGFWGAVILVPIVSVITISILLGSYLSDRYGKPAQPEVCVDSFEFVSPASERHKCAPGATLETVPVTGTDKIQVRCSCKK